MTCSGQAPEVPGEDGGCPALHRPPSAGDAGSFSFDLIPRAFFLSLALCSGIILDL